MSVTKNGHPLLVLGRPGPCLASLCPVDKQGTGFQLQLTESQLRLQGARQAVGSDDGRLQRG